MKATIILTISLLTIALVSCGQTTSKSAKTEFTALAKLVSIGEGSKIYIAKYKIIKDFTDTTFAETLKVCYYFYKNNTQ